MFVLWVIVQMVLIIAGLLLAVGIIFYGFAWIALAAVSLVPAIGKRHRHQRWDDLNRQSARGGGKPREDDSL